MALPQVIDVDALLQPISEEAPSGVDPRSDSSSTSLYYRTKDARNAARSAERATVEIGGAPPEEWGTVADTAGEILGGHGKDLEIAAWLIEALLRQEGFAGLRDGLKVMTGLVTGFWGSCYPELDEDGVEGKVSAVAGLNGSGAVGTLIQPIRLVSITQGSQGSFSLWNYEQATDLAKVTDNNRRQERIDNGAVTMEQFMESVADTPASFFAETQAAIVEALAALADMSSAFDVAAGADAPPVSALRELLEEISRSITHFAADKLAVANYSAASEESGPAEEGETAGSGTGETTTVVVRKIEGYQSREEALAELSRIAAYFRKTEPHSPMSYTLDDAVRRARMSLPELLLELVEDPSHLQRILLAAGIKPPEPAEQGY
ncbi:type VI secretion system protein TssA [Shinella curvata]|uniref:Type VI secretion system protein TssA n=1 Tax=Shinella curvata TaxID=1817964 RepID=A0ABT8XEI2_9HYPH|nr:type VI secretion system protein TssA [Shinella curvata]MCJ8055740.1 type VI secretion system protein TssA [Shinella curvata]MDO6122157.1 type VI secretion system protein TssA [Shinella curvata]